MITASLSLKLLVRISLMLEGLVIDLEHVLDIRVYVVSVNVSVLIVAVPCLSAWHCKEKLMWVLLGCKLQLCY